MHRRQVLGVIAAGGIGSAAYLGLRGDDASHPFRLEEFSVPGTVSPSAGFDFSVEIVHQRDREARFRGTFVLSAADGSEQSLEEPVRVSFSGATGRNVFHGVPFDGGPGRYRAQLVSPMAANTGVQEVIAER